MWRLLYTVRNVIGTLGAVLLNGGIRYRECPLRETTTYFEKYVTVLLVHVQACMYMYTYNYIVIH